MDFSFNRKQLSAAVKKVAKVVPSSSPIKELTGILIEADSENFEVSLTATCIEMSVRHTQPAAVNRSGGAIVNASLFHELLESFGGDVVVCRTNDKNQMQMVCGKTECVIPVLPAKNFPKLELNADYLSENAVEIKEIGKLARQTVFAADKNNVNMALKCIKLELDNSGFKAAACDGNRMISVSSANVGEGAMSFLIPAPAFNKLASIAEENQTLQVCRNDSNVIFSAENFVFSAKCVDAVFVDVDMMLKSFRPTYEALAGAKIFETALETVTAADNGMSPVRMLFQLGCILLESESEFGKSHVSVNAEVGSVMPDTGFYYQPNKLLQCMKSMDGNIRIQASATGILLVTSEYQTYLQVAVRPSAKSKRKTSKTKNKTKADKAA